MGFNSGFKGLKSPFCDIKLGFYVKCNTFISKPAWSWQLSLRPACVLVVLAKDYLLYLSAIHCDSLSINIIP